MVETSKFKMITAEELHELRQQNAEICLLHTLPEIQYLKTRIPNSEQACVYEVTFVEQVEKLTEDRNCQIVVYGADSETMDAFTAAEKLDMAGYKDITILHGGIAEWQAQGFPLEGTDPQKTESPDLVFTDGSYQIDCKQSNIGWTGRNLNTSHYGNVDIQSGVIQVVGGRISGDFEIDMTSISNINLAGDELQPVLLDHLKSDDFFHTSLFPAARFEITDVSPLEVNSLSSPNFKVDGNLKMHGVQAEQNFPAIISQAENGSIILEAHFDIDRTRWNVIYGSAKYFKHLGMHLVFDHITIELRIITAAD